MRYFLIDTKKEDLLQIVDKYIDEEFLSVVKKSMVHSTYESFKKSYAFELRTEMDNLLVKANHII